MGGEEDGFALVLEALDDLADLHAAERIEAAGGLVEDQQVGIVDQRLGQADALLHALGVGLDGALAGVFQLDQLEQLVNAAVRLGARDAEDARVEAEQFLGGEELVVVGQLGQVADALAGDGLAHVHAEQEGGAAGGVDEAQQHVHGGGLAGAVGAEKAKDFAGADAQVEVVDGHFPGLPRVLRPKLNPQIPGFNNRFHGS